MQILLKKNLSAGLKEKDEYCWNIETFASSIFAKDGQICGYSNFFRENWSQNERIKQQDEHFNYPLEYVV